MAVREFPNWKLGEKKALKEAEPLFVAAEKKLKAKLGDDWVFDVEWGTFGQYTEGNQYRNEAGKYVYSSLLDKLVDQDLSHFDENGVAAINKACGHRITFAMGPENDTYPFSDRCSFVASADGIRIVWRPSWFAYDYNGQYLFKTLSTNSSPYPGTWTYEELVNVKTGFPKVEAALAKVQAKLGAAWQFNVDWASVELGTRGNNYRNDVSRYWLDVINGFTDNDIHNAKCDADVVEALNDTCSKKLVSFKMGPKGEYKEGGGRLNLTVGESGITIDWSPDWFAYAYADPYVTNWILANC